MKDVVWIIQKNLTSELHRWERALVENKSSFRYIEIIPFDDNLPDVEVTPGASIVCHGSTTLIKGAPMKDWRPGVFFHPDHFRPSLWKNIYGPHFLNSDGHLMKLKDVELFAEYMFVRPNGDFKDFSGSLVDRAGMEKFVKSVQEGGYTFDDTLDVFIAPEKHLFEEYRMFIVNGKVVSSSKYRLRTILDKKPNAPQEIVDFANRMAKIWSPEPAYVMDICKTDKGELKLLELNCFNASGVYAAPLIPIIQAVENLF